MKLVFLGTSAGAPSKERNVSSCALDLLAERGSVWLFDCGEGTQRQIMHTHIKPGKIEKIFITHLHGDHLFGLMPLLCSLSLHQRANPITVFGPPGIKAYIETCIKITQAYIDYALNIIEVSEGLIFEDEQFSVYAWSLHHRITCFGYRILEKDHPGALDVDKLQKVGIKPGPIFQKLKNGECVTLEDGRVINGQDYLKPDVKGRIVVIFGDTRPTPNQLVLAQDADVVVHEATVDASREDWALQFGHTTSELTAKMAKEARAKKLILTHISARYVVEDEPQLLAECRYLFPQTYIAHDFEVFDIPMKKYF